MLCSELPLVLLLLCTYVHLPVLFTTQRIYYAHTEHAALPHTATVENYCCNYYWLASTPPPL
eukprot:4281-Heterococcus_DN1.PRE.2